MTNLVPEFWEIDGQSLHTYASTVVNLGGDVTGGVGLRGSNLTVPNRPGTIWREKVPDERVLSLGVTVTGLNANGTSQPTPALERARFNANLRAVRRLFWRDTGAQFTLTKRWYEADFSGSPVATLVTASALAEFADGMEPEQEGDSVAVFAVDLLLADPFFYGATVTRTATVAAPISVTNPGDARVTGANATLTFTGPLTNPVASLGGKTLSLGAVLSGGQSVVVNLADWTVVRNDGANLIGALGYSGSRSLLPVPMGASTLSLTGSGGGSVALSFKPPYL